MTQSSVRGIPRTFISSLPNSLMFSWDSFKGEYRILVKEINEGGYRQINRYWEATPTEICEAAVDEISKFVLDPTSYKDVMENLQTLADNYWSNN